MLYEVITIPPNAQLIRNLMNGAQYVHDHVMHFYHLHALDWVDVVSALNADPKATSALAQSITSYPKSSPGYFRDMKKKLKDFRITSYNVCYTKLLRAGSAPASSSTAGAPAMSRRRSSGFRRS